MRFHPSWGQPRLLRRGHSRTLAQETFSCLELAARVNSERNLANRAPSEAEVERWMEENLPRHVSY
jgi:hypothetical protein